MDYITGRELSERWGIGRCRINRLAREGRIPGAKLYGKTWLFPADAAKPIDGRTRAGRARKERDAAAEDAAGGAENAAIEGEAGEDGFRFPLFEFKDAASFDPPLSKDELALKTFTERFIACRFEETEALLPSLPEWSPDRYLRIYALYCGCMQDIMLCKTGRFMGRFGRLRAELAEDFPHRDEMAELARMIEATLGSDEYYARAFNLKPTYRYHESFLPRLCNLEAFCLTLSGADVSSAALMACELNCRFLEKTDNRFDLQSLHIYLGIAYAIAGRTEERNYHLGRAIALAERFDMFFNLATQYYYMPREFAPALEGRSATFRETLERLGDDLRDRLARFSEELRVKNIYAILTSDDYLYVVFAVRRLTNKQIASRMHTSVGAVGKKYGKLYALLGVRSKAKLVALYRSVANSGGEAESAVAAP